MLCKVGSTEKAASYDLSPVIEPHVTGRSVCPNRTTRAGAEAQASSWKWCCRCLHRKLEAGGQPDQHLGGGRCPLEKPLWISHLWELIGIGPMLLVRLLR